MAVYQLTKRIPIEIQTSELMIENPHSAEIILNNSVLHKDLNYIILEDGMVQFNTLLEDTDELIVKYQISSALPVVTTNNSRSLYQKFSSSPILSNNASFKACLFIRNQSFTSDFCSKFSPFYLTNAQKKIKMDTGELFNSFKQEELDFAVYSASLDFDEKLLIEGYTSVLDEIGLKVRERWVRYKTVLDILTSVYVSKAGRVGSERKKVGNMEIERDHKIPYISDLLRRAQEAFDEAEKDVTTLVFGSSGLTGFVKGGDTSYPLNSRMW